MKILPVTNKIIILTFLLVPYIACAQGPDNEYWDNGKPRVMRKYNKIGNLVETNYYRQDGTLEEREKYDAYGHMIEEANYGENGQLRVNADGWAVIRKSYQNGQMVSESYYDASGKVIERKGYNDLGDLVAKQYVGDNIDPDEEYSPPPTLAGETTSYYDSSGRPEGSTSVQYDTDPWWWWDDD